MIYYDMMPQHEGIRFYCTKLPMIAPMMRGAGRKATRERIETIITILAALSDGSTKYSINHESIIL